MILITKYDFGGYATKHNLRCSDGRVITSEAFKHQHGVTVPLVWAHRRDDPQNVIGNALLEYRPDGVYAHASFNGSPRAEQAKMLVEHGDIRSLSIYANHLKQQGDNVEHGQIREVSLVMAGANPGAFIDNITLGHGDEERINEEAAVIYSPTELEHGDPPQSNSKDNSVTSEDPTLEEVYNTFNQQQKDACEFLVAMALQEAGVAHEDKEDGMTRNVFEGIDDPQANNKNVLSHDDIVEIRERAFNTMKVRGSLKEAVLEHAGTYGIDNIDILFPDAKAVENDPALISRRMDWVSSVLNGTKHSPFSRIKMIQADITEENARARGYIKGHEKKDEVFKLLKRSITPQTIYKKQKLDRDDILDIGNDFNIVPWLKAEMRIMLDEELARAILVGDGRPSDSEDKISEDHIIPIWKDADLFAVHVLVDIKTGDTATDKAAKIREAVIRARKNYYGSGAPKLYTGTDFPADMILTKDSQGRYIYETDAAVASALRVSDIVEVPLLDGQKRTVNGTDYTLVGIVVNLADYTIGADRGGEVTMFDDFDIDYNQQKYLIETRVSGALTRPRSALVIETRTVA